MRTFILISVIATMLSSCVLHQHYTGVDPNAGDIFVIRKTGGLAKCPPWPEHVLPEAPKIPVIPYQVKGDKDAEQEILINSLASHRRHIIILRKIIQDSYEGYLARCR